MMDGTRLRAVCMRPPGAWGAPLDTVQHDRKLRDCLSVQLTAPQIDALLDRLARLDALDAGEVRALIASL